MYISKSRAKSNQGKKSQELPFEQRENNMFKLVSITESPPNFWHV